MFDCSHCDKNGFCRKYSSVDVGVPCPGNGDCDGYVEAEEMAELKPCPFCGRELLSIEGWKDLFWIECINCQTEGPSGETKEEAIEVWNWRAEDGK